VLPRAELPEAIEAMGRIREGLAHTTSRGDTPTFTASFGIAHSSDAPDLDDLVQRADRALFAAKDAGRDRICIDGHDIPIVRTLTAL
jgi:PleD family two-component response regulator